MASFYGWSIDYIESLPHGDVVGFYEAITVLEAQMRLVDMNIADYPNMKKEDRRKFYRQMKKIAYPESIQSTVSFEDFIKRMTNDR